jgi:hypothetical protein
VEVEKLRREEIRRSRWPGLPLFLKKAGFNSELTQLSDLINILELLHN